MFDHTWIIYLSTPCTYLSCSHSCLSTVNLIWLLVVNEADNNSCRWLITYLLPSACFLEKGTFVWTFECRSARAPASVHHLCICTERLTVMPASNLMSGFSSVARSSVNKRGAHLDNKDSQFDSDIAKRELNIAFLLLPVSEVNKYSSTWLLPSYSWRSCYWYSNERNI